MTWGRGSGSWGGSWRVTQGWGLSRVTPDPLSSKDTKRGYLNYFRHNRLQIKIRVLSARNSSDILFKNPCWILNSSWAWATRVLSEKERVGRWLTSCRVFVNSSLSIEKSLSWRDNWEQFTLKDPAAALESSAAIMFASCQKVPMFVLSQLRFWVNTGPNLKLSNSTEQIIPFLCVEANKWLKSRDTENKSWFNPHQLVLQWLPTKQDLFLIPSSHVSRSSWLKWLGIETIVMGLPRS